MQNDARSVPRERYGLRRQQGNDCKNSFRTVPHPCKNSSPRCAKIICTSQASNRVIADPCATFPLDESENNFLHFADSLGNRIYFSAHCSVGGNCFRTFASTSLRC